MPINTIKHDLESAIDNANQEMDSKNFVAIISQIINNKVFHTCHYLLSNYSLKNRCFDNYGKFYLPIIDLLHLHIL